MYKQHKKKKKNTKDNTKNNNQKQNKKKKEKKRYEMRVQSNMKLFFGVSHDDDVNVKKRWGRKKCQCLNVACKKHIYQNII